MAVTKYDKSELITKLGGFKVVTTESGPIKPAKEQLIKAMTKGVMEPIKNQLSKDWDRRIYGGNAPLFDPAIRKTVKDVMQEAASQTAHRGMRLNLESIDAEQAHCKLAVSRRGKDYIVDIYYPNADGDISVIVKDQFNNLKQFDTDIDSEDYIRNFGNSILTTIDSFDTDRNTPGSYDEMMYNDLEENSPANDQPAEEGLLPQPGFTDAVSWQLGRDMRETRRILTEAEFTEDDFAATPDAGADVSQDIQDANAADQQLNNPVPGNEQAGGTQDEEMSYIDFAVNHATILKGGITDHMAEVIASSADETPLILGRDKQLNGFAGIKDMPDMDIINAFGKLFGFISDGPETASGRPAPETANDVRLPRAKWEELFTALEDDYTTPERFKESIGKILPDMFDSKGNAHNPAADLTNVELPDETGMSNSIGPNEEFTVAEPAPAGPAAGTQDVYGDLASDIAQGNMEFQPDETPDDTNRYDQIFQNIQ